MEIARICRVCHIEKPLTYFSKCGKYHLTICKPCFNEAERNRPRIMTMAACSRCGKTFERERSRVKEGAKVYCSHECSCKRNVPFDAPFEGKVCKTCGVFKALAEYTYGKGACKPCMAAASKLWKQQHPERMHAIYKRAYWKNPEKYRAKNREQRKRIGAQYGGYHRKPGVYEKVLEWTRQHPDKIAEYARRCWSKPSFRQKGAERCSRRRAILRNAPQVEKINKNEILERDNWTCYLCGKNIRSYPSRKIHLDHVVALSKGGTHTTDNLRVACSLCNSRKHTKTVAEFAARWGLPKQATP